MTQLDVKKICRQIHEATERIISEKRAREFLVRLGTHTKDGRLTPRYGGPREPSGGGHEHVQDHII